MALGTFDRDRAVRALGEGTFDLLVIGGGVTGAGVALDAASRGLRTALVERDDFASGTSSKSSKLVHGGLRYLQNGDVRLVYEALRERQRLLRNAPHLVSPLPFLIPIMGKGGVINPKIARALGSAMWMYDLTGGARIGKLHKRLSTEEALEHMPTLPADRVGSAYLYYDAAADDARLTLTLAGTAALDHGAVVVNHAGVVELTKDAHGHASGAIVDVAGGERLEVRARAVVNAAGVWSDTLRALDERADPDSIRPAKGIHITVPWDRVRNDIAAVVPVPGDKRSVFVVPWLSQGDGTFALTYVGTTDTDYDGPLDDPRCTSDDIAYLLRAVNAAIGARDGGALTEADVRGTWAGLRPLVKAATSGRTADLSRRHRVTDSASGMITVTGGKLTTYREMAQDTVDAVVHRLDDLPRSARRCRTARLALRGADGAAPAIELNPHLGSRYGGESRAVQALVDADASLGERLVAGLPYLRAEAVHAVRQEMALDLDDVLTRRTRARLQGVEETAAAAVDVAALIGPELGWSPERAAHEAASYRKALSADRP